MNRPVFNSPDHYLTVAEVVRDNPPKERETLFEYLERIALEAALMKPGDGMIGGKR
jgi:hypothetical protein